MNSKIYIYYLINFFILICMLISSLLSLYYITPTNYDIKLLDNNKNLYKKITVKPNSTYKLLKKKIKNKYIYFDKNLNLIFSNIFKSSDIFYDNKYMVKTYNSDIIIVNNTNKNITVNIYFVNNK